MFWAFGHVVVNTVHRVSHELRTSFAVFSKQNLLTKLKTLSTIIICSALFALGGLKAFTSRATRGLVGLS